MRKDIRRSRTVDEIPTRRAIMRTYTGSEKTVRKDSSTSKPGIAGLYKSIQLADSHARKLQITSGHAISYVNDPPRMPFLSRQGLPIEHLVELEEVRIGSKLIGEGNFTRTMEIKAFKWNKLRGKSQQSPLVKNKGEEEPPRLAKVSASISKKDLKKDAEGPSSSSTRQYAIKSIHPRVGEVALDDLYEVQNLFGVASRRLVVEAIYLANLNHPSILPFRGIILADRYRFQQKDLDAIHLITDRLGETLEARMKTWKQLRLNRQKHKSITRQKDAFILGSLQMDLAMIGHDLMHNLPKTSKQIEREKEERKIEAYPVDLVALQTNYVLQVAHALEYLHSKGIVVRDLRPNTIGFKEYPHHHTIQLFHFGFCREMPASSENIPPENIQASPTSSSGGGDGNLSSKESMDMDETDANSASAGFSAALQPTAKSMKDGSSQHKFRAKLNSMDLSSNQFRRSGSSRDVFRSNRSDAKHYRAPESYPVVRAPRLRVPSHLYDDSSQNQAQNNGDNRGGRDPGFQRSGTAESNTSTNTSASLSLNGIAGPTCNVVGTGSSAGPAFGRCGTTESAESNVTTASSYSNTQEQTTMGDYRYQYTGYTTKADIYSLAMIYHEMLAEGKPFKRSALEREGHYYKIQSVGLRPSLGKHHFPRSVKAVLEQAWNPVVERRFSAKEMAQTLSAILHMLEGKGIAPKRMIAKETSASDEEAAEKTITAMQLPKRAAAQMVSIPLHANNKNGWSSIWNQKEVFPGLDTDKVMDAIQAQRVNIKDEDKKKKLKQQPQPKQVKSWTSWIPQFQLGGMVESHINAKSCNALGIGIKPKMKEDSRDGFLLGDRGVRRRPVQSS